MYNSKLEIVYANSPLQEKLHFQQQDLIGRLLTDFVSREAIQRLLRLGKNNSFSGVQLDKIRISTAKGPSKIMSFKLKTFSVVTRASKEPIPIMVAFLKEQSSQCTTLSLMQDKLLALSSIPILGADSRGITNIFNQAAAETFGFAQDEVIGKNVALLMPERIAKYHDQFIKNYLRTGKGKVVDKIRKETGKKKDGTIFPIELKISSVSVEGEKLFMGYCRDRSSIITRDEQSQRSALADRLFPPSIASRVSQGEKVIYDYHESASLLFCDIKGYTALSAQLTAYRIVKLLDEIFSGFDKAVLEDLNCEKLKTMGDCYMLGSGFPSEFDGHASELVEAALRMMSVIDGVNKNNTDLPVKISLRFGINTGAIVSGIVGTAKPLYDCFSSAVNAASRMESTGIAGEIQISESSFNRLTKEEHKKMFHKREGVFAKGLGLCTTYITNFTGHLSGGEKAIADKTEPKALKQE